jgi:hypothetical protein
MKIVIATFDHNYYLWQVLVQINNFIKHGYDVDTHYVLSAPNPSPALKAMMECDRIKCKFHIYTDTRNASKYPSSLRPHILEKFFTEHPEFEKETILYTDPDVIFTKKLDFSEMEKDEYWHLSDTRSYIDTRYIKSKSEQLFKEMCQIARVTPESIEAIDDHAGGAQYLMKNVTAEFWKKVFIDCENLYNYMKSTESKYHPEHPIQSWTADMWAVLWNAVYFGHQVRINKDMDFSWATDNIKRWDETYIFHNAGIAGNGNDTHFSKVVYQLSPFNKEIKLRDDNCTFNYVKEIRETEENFKDIIW